LAEQAYESGARIELSERSNTIVVPPLSRYARVTAQRQAAEPTDEAEQAKRPAAPSVATTRTPEGARRDPPSKSVEPPRVQAPAQPVPSPPPRASAPLPTVLPPEREQRVPFWKRIHLPRAQGPAQAPTPTSLEPVLERLEALEKLLAESQKATIGQLEQMDENLERLLELEDELGLSEVRERLALVEAGQVEIADALHSVARNLSVLSVVMALIVAAGAFALGVIL